MAAPPPSPPLADDVEARYREAVRGQWERLSLRGLTSEGEGVSPKLEDVYVELQVVAEVPDARDDWSAEERRLLHERERQGLPEGEQERALDGLRYRRWKQRARSERAQHPPRSVEETLRTLEGPALVLLGDPGSGKSTLLHHLALRALGSPEWLPLCVPLAAYDECLRHGPIPLEEFLSVYFARWRGLPGLAPLFHQALESGRALVLLDGLDEVLTLATRRHVAAQVSALLERWGGAGNRFVLTSRFIGYREVRLGPAVPQFMVVDLGPAEVERFAHQWCTALEREQAGGSLSPEALPRAQEEAEALLEEVRGKPGVERLATHPLLLTMLALMRRQSGPLPSRRVELYARYVHTLLGRWGPQRSDGARRQAAEPSDAHAVQERLMDLALWLQRHRPAGTASQADLVRALVERGGQALPTQERQRAEDEARRVWHEVKELTGLIGERGQDAYGFVHLTFQEYFVGRALARLSREARWEVLRPHLHAPRWHEPLLLCAGQLGALEKTQEEAEALVEAVLDHGSEHEEVLHRDLFLALEVLAEDVTREERLLDRVSGQLEPLATAQVPALLQRTLEGGVVLLRLGHAPTREAWLDWVSAHEPRGAAGRALTRLLEAVADLKPRGWDSRQLSGMLGDVAARDERMRQALLARLADETAKDTAMRLRAARALGALASRDTAVRLALLARLTDRVATVRCAAVEALTSVASRDARVCHALIGLLEDEDGDVRARTFDALGAWAGRDEAVRQALLASLEAHGYPRSQVFFRLADQDARVRGVLLARFGSDPWWLRNHSRDLSALASRHDEVRQSLLGWLDDANPHRRSGAARALGAMPDRQACVREALLARLGDEDPETRTTVVAALGAWAGQDASVRRILLDLLGVPGPEQSVAARALSARVGSDAQVRQAFLQLLLLDPVDRWHVPFDVLVSALGPVVGGNAQVRQVLLSRLGDSDARGRSALACSSLHEEEARLLSQALGTAASQDTRVRHALLARVEDASRTVRCVVTGALGTLAGGDEEVRQVLLTRLTDVRGGMSGLAIQALGEVARVDARVRRELVARLAHADASSRKTLVEVLRPEVGVDEQVRRNLLERLADPDEKVRSASAEALGTVVGGDERVAHALIARLDDEEDFFVRERLTQALRAVANATEPMRQALIARLTHGNMRVRREVAELLGASARDSARVRQALLARLEDEEAMVREASATALGVAVGDAEVREVLLARLEDSDTEVRSAVIQALGAATSSEEPVRRALLARLEDSDERTRSEVVQALGAAANSEEPVRRALLARLDDPELRVRLAVLAGGGPMLGGTVGGREVLLARLEDEDHALRSAAVRALGAAASSEAPVRLALLARLGDEDEGVRNAAVEVLRAAVAGGDARVREALLAWLEHENPYARQATVQVLSPSANTDPRVHEALLARFDDADEWVRQWIIEAAVEGELGREEPVRRALLARLGDAHWFIRCSAANALAKNFGDAPGVAAALLPWLSVSPGDAGFPLDDLRGRVARCLGQWASHDEGLRERLMTMARDARRSTRQWAAIALSFIRGAPPPVAPLIFSSLLEDPRDSETWDRRLTAAEVLLNAREHAVSTQAIDCALSALDHGTEPWYEQDDSGRVRSRAAELLGGIEPTYRHERVLGRLLKLLREDASRDVREASWHAVHRLLAAPVER